MVISSWRGTRGIHLLNLSLSSLSLGHIRMCTYIYIYGSTTSFVIKSFTPTELLFAASIHLIDIHHLHYLLSAQPAFA
ncbi:hypothetical protein F5B18DRAFT_144074 [Nemania serpens]|nr:hypothetical protein F5B18DRAFT_144074 [Nemania serpens]